MTYEAVGFYESLFGHNADHIIVYLAKMGRAEACTDDEIVNAARILGREEFTRLMTGWRRQPDVDLRLNKLADRIAAVV